MGAPGTYYLNAHEWVGSLSYRYLHSFRDFHGSDEVPFPPPNDQLYADTKVHGFDLSVTYAVTKRLSLSLALPFQHGSRETYGEHDGLTRHTMRAGGMGDLSLIANVWLLDPAECADGNIAFGFGLKAPTGDSRATDYSYRDTGPVLRPVDPAIQLGDGGWGVILSLQTFRKIFKGATAYLQGSYLINPREMNGTPTVFADLVPPDEDIGYRVNSVPDQYFARGGVEYEFWPKQGLAVSLGARIDGVPVHDLIGGSEGWRLPGYAIAIDPGLSLSRGKNLFRLTAPVAVERHGDVSISDRRTNHPLGGYAAFADFVIFASYSRRF